MASLLPTLNRQAHFQLHKLKMDSPDPWADFYNKFQQFSQQHTALHVQTFQPSKRSLAYDTLHNQSEKEQPNINEVEDTTVWVLSSVEASDLEDTEDKEDSDNFSPVKGPVKKCRVKKEWLHGRVATQ